MREEFGWLALMHASVTGLYLGAAVGVGASYSGFPVLAWSRFGAQLCVLAGVIGRTGRLFSWIPLHNLRAAALRYWQFPLINSASVFLNTLPIFIISAYHDGRMIGWYALTTWILDIPLGMMSSSVSSVYYRAGAEAYNQNPSWLRPIYLKTVGRLSLLAAPLVVFVRFVVPVAGGFIFGEGWDPAGVIMQLVLDWKVSELLTVPESDLVA